MDLPEPVHDFLWTISEELDSEEICSGFFFMVAVDDSMKPTKVPQFDPGDEEQRLYSCKKAREGMRMMTNRRKSCEI